MACSRRRCRREDGAAERRWRPVLILGDVAFSRSYSPTRLNLESLWNKISPLTYFNNVNVFMDASPVVLNHGDGRPHVFIAAAISSAKGIPKSFLRRCGKDLSNSMLLKVPGGSTWTIELEKCNNDMVLLWKGWRKFMEHYSIGHGHLIVFKYKGNSTFHVIIFNKSASEIDYSLSSGKTSYLGSKLPSPKTKNVIETEDLEDLIPRRRMRIEPHLPYSQLSPTYSPRGSEVPIDTDPEEPPLSQAEAGLTGRIKQPTCRMSRSEMGFHGPTLPRPLTTPELACKVDSKHPFFKKVIRRCYMDKLHIPCGFIKQHIQEKQRATLRYANRSWSVRLIRNRHVRGALLLSFSAGWAAFARETHLRTGNVCVFKLIDRNDNVFEVSILSVQHRNKLSKQRVNRYELAFRGPTPPKPLNTPELASEFESEHPFFKVVIQQWHQSKAFIPGQFAKQHIQENKEMATLRFSDRSWPVRLLSYWQETRVSFCAGWPAFARETHLCVGNICVFELIDMDDVVFQVSVFSSAGGIKNPTCRASHSGLDFDGPTPSKPLKSPDLASNINSEHPFFILVTPQSCIHCLGVPVGFAKQHLQEHKQIATLRHSDRSWPVKILTSHGQATGTTTLSFTAGWRAFARETHLRAGNVCLFELIDRGDTLFRVSILTGAGNDSVHVDRDELQKYYLRPLQHRNDFQGSQ